MGNIITLATLYNNSELPVASGAKIFGEPSKSDLGSGKAIIMPYVYKNQDCQNRGVDGILLQKAEKNPVQLESFLINFLPADIPTATDTLLQYQLTASKYILLYYRNFFSDNFAVYDSDFETYTEEKTYTVPVDNRIKFIRLYNDAAVENIYSITAGGTEIEQGTVPARATLPDLELSYLCETESQIVITFDGQVKSIYGMNDIKEAETQQ